MSAREYPFAVIGNPDNRRLSMWQHALERLTRRRAHVLSYRELLGCDAELATLNAESVARRARAFVARLALGSIVRIDSPGEDFEVARALLMYGAQHPDARISVAEARALGYQRGRILHPGQQFAGYARLLEQLSRALSTRADIRLMNAPDAIATLFDKAACRERLQAHGVRVPKGLPSGLNGGLNSGLNGGLDDSAGIIVDYDDLRRRMHEHGSSRVFVKLRHGSSASGVVAYRADASGESAITSTVMSWRGRRSSGSSGSSRRADTPMLFNSLRLREYQRGRDVRALIDALAREGVIVEQWIDKARLGRGPHADRFDLRVLVIAGQARHAVVRRSRSPMTNLHLGNRRATIDELIAERGPACWLAAKRLAEDASACVPGALYVGVDVMIESSTEVPYIVELNAFGDLLPNVLESGLDTYSAELLAMLHTGASSADDAPCHPPHVPTTRDKPGTGS